MIKAGFASRATHATSSHKRARNAGSAGQEEKGEKCRPVLVKSPSNVNHVRISPLEIDYIIEQKVIFND